MKGSIPNFSANVYFCSTEFSAVVSTGYLVILSVLSARGVSGQSASVATSWLPGLYRASTGFPTMSRQYFVLLLSSTLTIWWPDADLSSTRASFSVSS